jgi:hypothetical protein
MSWHFRGSLCRIELQRHDRILLPFDGCAWLAGPIGAPSAGEASPVHDAHLELIRRDNPLLAAIAEEAEAIARRNRIDPPPVSGCIYHLGDAVRILLAVSEDTMALIERTLLAPMAEGQFYVNAAIDFPGFAGEHAPHGAFPLSRSQFFDGQGALYFDACQLTVGFNDWAADDAFSQLPFFPHLAAANLDAQRL